MRYGLSLWPIAINLEFLRGLPVHSDMLMELTQMVVLGSARNRGASPLKHDYPKGYILSTNVNQ